MECRQDPWNRPSAAEDVCRLEILDIRFQLQANAKLECGETYECVIFDTWKTKIYGIWTLRFVNNRKSCDGRLCGRRGPDRAVSCKALKAQHCRVGDARP